jgi:cell division protein FtsZ
VHIGRLRRRILAHGALAAPLLALQLERGHAVVDQLPSAPAHKRMPRMRQAQLPLEIVSKGRFDRTEPTVHQGEDLDLPTWLRRGVKLN